MKLKVLQWKPLNTPPLNTPKPLITPTRPGPEFLLNTECIKLPLNAPKDWLKAAYYAHILPKIHTFSKNFLPKTSKIGNFQQRFLENLSRNLNVTLLSNNYQKCLLLHCTKTLILIISEFLLEFYKGKVDFGYYAQAAYYAHPVRSQGGRIKRLSLYSLSISLIKRSCRYY